MIRTSTMANPQIKRMDLLIMRRAYCAANQVTTKQGIGSMMSKEAMNGNSAVDKKEEKPTTYWMRDPKTGNFMPENHIGEIDAADLRARLLPPSHVHSPRQQ